MRSGEARFTAGLALVALAIAITGCSSPSGTAPSADEFCQDVEDHADALASQLATGHATDPSQLPLEFTISNTGADLQYWWTALSDKAPADVTDDVNHIAAAWNAEDAEGTPQARIEAVAQGLVADGSLDSFAEYSTKTCGVSFMTPPPEVVPTPDESVEPVSTDPILQDSWVDSDGYSFEISILQPKAEAAIDIANAKPGQANLTWTYATRATLKNTTEARNAPSPELYITPMWPSDSPVCTAPTQKWHAFDDNIGLEDQWCSLMTAPYLLRQSANEIPANGSALLSTEGKSIAPLIVPEDQADAVLEALLNPPVWAFARTGDQGRTQCLVKSGGFNLIVATGGFSCPAA